MAQSMRDKIRSATVGKQAKFKTETLEFEGLEIEFRQPNLKDRKELLAHAKNEKGDFDMIEFIVWSVILNTYVPGSNEKVFDKNDYDMLMEQNTGSFVDKFGNKIAELMNVEEDVKN